MSMHDDESSLLASLGKLAHESSTLHAPAPYPAADKPTPVPPQPETTEQQGEEEDDSEPPAILFTPDQKKVNFTEERPVSEPWAGKFPALKDCLALFREAHGNVAAVTMRYAEVMDQLHQAETELVSRLIKQGRALTDADGEYWYRVYLDAMAAARLDDIGRKATERPESQWAQTLDADGVKLRMGRPVQRLGSGTYSNEEIISYVARKSKTGATFDIPLYHSGLWFRLQSAALRELTALQKELEQARVTLGSESKGLAFSNASQTLLSISADYVLSYVTDANVNFRTPTDLKTLLLTTDIPAALLGMAATMFPDGFPYAAPCVAEPGKCNHVVREKLNLHNLLWVDTNALTKEQRSHMATRFSVKYTEEQILAYQAQHLYGKAKVVWFDDIGLRLTVPSLYQQDLAGRAWIDGIVEMTQGAFNEPPYGSNRNKYIRQLGEATTARQYAHFVSAVLERTEDGEKEITTNVDVIAGILNHVFSDDKYADAFFKQVTEYIEGTLVSMVAVVSYNCPNCNTPTATKFHDRFEHLVPLDTLTTFFTLANRKLNAVQM